MHISTLPHFPTSTLPNFHTSQLPHFLTSTLPNYFILWPSFHGSVISCYLFQSVSEKSTLIRGIDTLFTRFNTATSLSLSLLLLEDHASVLRRRRRVLSMPTKLHGAKTCRFTKRNRVRRMSGVCFLPSSWTESLDRSWRTECLFKNPVALQSARRKYRII